MKKVLLLVLGLGFLVSAAAATTASIARYPFSNPQQTQQFQRLTQSLRCLVCQNETLADSEVPLALDLRQQIYTRVVQGQSDQQIEQYLVARYGDFILLDPPFQWETSLLWVAPFLLLLIGVLVLWRVGRKKAL